MPQGKQIKTSRGPQPGPELDKKTADLLQMYAPTLATAGQFVPGVGGRIIGDINLAGNQKPQLGQAFHPDMPRDARMNALLSSAATLGLDLTTDVGLRGLMALLASKGLTGAANPAVQSGVFMAKGYAMNPVYNSIREKVFDSNLGEKAADVTKTADSFFNHGRMQAQYGELLPLLEMIAQQPGAADDVTSMEGVIRQKLIDEKQNPVDFYGGPLKAMLPKNVHPAVDKATEAATYLIDNTNQRVKRSIAGGKRDVETVVKGMEPMARLFGNTLRKTLIDNIPLTMGKK